MTSPKDYDRLVGSLMFLSCRRGWAAQNVDDAARGGCPSTRAPRSARSLPQARSRPLCRFGPTPVFSLNSKTMQNRLFTVREANELLPFLSSRVLDLRLLHQELLARGADVPSSQEITFRRGKLG